MRKPKEAIEKTINRNLIVFFLVILLVLSILVNITMFLQIEDLKHERNYCKTLWTTNTLYYIPYIDVQDKEVAVSFQVWTQGVENFTVMYQKNNETVKSVNISLENEGWSLKLPLDSEIVVLVYHDQVLILYIMWSYSCHE